MISLKKNLAQFLFCILITVPKPGFAGTCGSGLDPVLVIATPVAFAAYNAALALDVTVNGSITISCTNLLLDVLPSFTVALSAGSGGSGFSPRKMSFGSQRLGYNLYTSASYATVWGDGTGSTATQSYGAGSGLATEAYTVFGKIPKSQYAPAGIYLDTITVTVTY